MRTTISLIFLTATCLLYFYGSSVDPNSEAAMFSVLGMILTGVCTIAIWFEDKVL